MHVPIVGRDEIQIMVGVKSAAFINDGSVPFDVGDQELLSLGEIGIDAVDRAIPILWSPDRNVTPCDLLIAQFHEVFELRIVIEADKFAIIAKGIDYPLALPSNMPVANILGRNQGELS